MDYRCQKSGSNCAYVSFGNNVTEVLQIHIGMVSSSDVTLALDRAEMKVSEIDDVVCQPYFRELYRRMRDNVVDCGSVGMF